MVSRVLRDQCRWRRGGWQVTIAFLLALPAIPAFTQPKKDEDPLSYDRKIGALIGRHCYKCHNEDKANGDINLAKDDNPRLILENAVVWRTALEKIESKEMPPEDAKQPSDEDRELIAKFLHQTLEQLDCNGSGDPGKPVIRRLNRAEYNQSVRYLTGLDLRIADSFPADATSYGFDNIAASLTLTSVQVEQYFGAAQKVVDALLNDATEPPKDTEQESGYRAVYFTNANKEGSDRAAAKKIMERFAKRAFRRPVESEWIDKLLVIYDRSRDQQLKHDNAIGNMIIAVLISPRFLMRAERNQPEIEHPYPIDDYDLASRMSFFLWSGPPDDVLMDLASRNQLHNPEQLDIQLSRMLADTRSNALIENFFARWLQFSEMAIHLPDEQAFPNYGLELHEAIAAEPRLTLVELIREDHAITNLIDADYTYANQILAKHYGLENVTGSSMQRLNLPDRRRGGLLTSAALLMAQADPGRTNVPRRGNFIAGTILGSPAPPPPPDVPVLDETGASEKDLTLRERLDAHRNQPQCASCHSKIDPLGFGFENYDATGAWRDLEVGKPVDASGELPDGRKFNGPIELKDILMERKEEFVATFATQLLIYALGRGPIVTDQCVVEDTIEAAKANSYRFSSIVKSIVHSYPFLHRQNPEL